MTLLEMKRKILGLIEELSPDSEYLTEAADAGKRLNEVINQVMYELARLKKIPKYVELEVKKGDRIEFWDLERLCGSPVYQIGQVSGVSCMSRANGTVLVMLENGTAQIDVFVYPERITGHTRDGCYELELSLDALEIMPYGVAGDLLKGDPSMEHGNVYADRYENMLQRLDPRYRLPGVYIEGGVNV